MKIKKIIGLLSMVILIGSCTVQNEPLQGGTVTTSLQVVPPGVNRVKFTISGPGMPVIQRIVPVTPGQNLSETFLVPKGPQRLFRIEAFNLIDYVEYMGQLTVNVDRDLITLNINAPSIIRYPLYITDPNATFGDPSDDVLYFYDYVNQTSSQSVITGIIPIGLIYTTDRDYNLNYIYNVGAKWAIFMGQTTAGGPWTAYRVDLQDANMQPFVLAQNTTTEQPCLQTGIIIADQMAPLNSWALVTLSGTDTTCNTSDDHTIAFKVSADSSTPWIDLTTKITKAFGIYSSDGRLDGVVLSAYDNITASSSVLQCAPTELRPLNCSVLLTGLISINTFKSSITDNGTYVLLTVTDINDAFHTYHYNPATKTINRIASLDNKSVDFIVSDDAFFYLADMDYSLSVVEVWKIPVDGSGGLQKIYSQPSVLLNSFHIAGQRLILGYNDANSDLLVSISKDGTEVINIGQSSAGIKCAGAYDAVRANTVSSFVFYDCQETNQEACYVKVNGTGRKCYQNFFWGPDITYTAIINGDRFVKIGRILADNATNIFSADINNPSGLVNLGQVQTNVITLPGVVYYGGGNILFVGGLVTAGNDLYFANTEILGSLNFIPVTNFIIFPSSNTF